MDRIMRKIKNEMTAQGITQKDIAKLLDVSPAMITQYFQLKSRLDFERFLKIVHEVFRKDYENLIVDFCRASNDKENTREALEWSLHRWRPGLSDAIYEVEQKNKTNVSDLYFLLLQSRKGDIDPEDFFREIQKYKFNVHLNKFYKAEGEDREEIDEKDIEADEVAQGFVIYSLCLMYRCCYKQKYNMIPGLAEVAFVYLDKIKSSFLRQAHGLSIKEMLAVAYLYSDNKECVEPILKELANENVKNYFPMIYLSTLALKSEVNMFNNYKKSISSIRQAITQLEEWGWDGYKRRRVHLEAIHDLVQMTNSKLDELYKTDSDQVLHYLSFKKYPIVKDMLEKLESKGSLTAFQLYCKGIYYKDIRIIRQSEKEFVKENNIHLWELPKRQIDLYLNTQT